MDKFALVIGNARTGSTMVGSIIDSHPRMICANETVASQTFWRDLSREAIIAEIKRNSADGIEEGRLSEGYFYTIETPEKTEIAVYADKTWNPALLLMAGDHGLLPRLAETMEAPIALIHSVRNPFDVIATMHKRSGAPLEDRARWFFMHCDAVVSLMERGYTPHHVRHESLVADARATAGALFETLGHPASRVHLDRIARAVNPVANKTRRKANWPAPLVADISARAAQYAFLEGYTFDS